MTKYLERIRRLVAGRDPLAVMGATSTTLEGLLVPESDTRLRHPEPGGWSPIEVACHLSDTELVYGDRLRVLLTVNSPHFPDFDQEAWRTRFAYGARPLAPTLELFAAQRRANLEILADLQPSELARAGVHARRGIEDVETTLLLWAGHDLVHLAQLERILAL